MCLQTDFLTMPLPHPQRATAELFIWEKLLQWDQAAGHELGLNKKYSNDVNLSRDQVSSDRCCVTLIVIYFCSFFPVVLSLGLFTCTVYDVHLLLVGEII